MNKLGWLIAIIGGFVGISALSMRNTALHPSSSSWKTYTKADVDSMVGDANIVLTIGIVVVIIGVMVLLTKYIVKNNNNKPSNFQTKKCLKCGKISNIDERFCSNCGNDLYNQGKMDTEDGKTQ